LRDNRAAKQGESAVHIRDLSVWARSTTHVVDDDKAWSVPVRAGLAARAHRTTGHAAEMAFFAVLTLVPSTVAVGSALGLTEKLLGPGPVRNAQDASVEAVRTLMGPELADKVISPFIDAQLAQPRGGVAIGGLLVAWWLSSHLFMSTSHALDSAYGVRDRRATTIQRFIALAFALGSVAVVAMSVELMVTGPLGDSVDGPAGRLGLGDEYAFAWSLVRWPLLLVMVVAFLVCLYRFSPNVRHCWRDCLPGALVGALLWILAAAAFRLTAGLRDSLGVASDDPAVNLIGQAVNAVVATVLWAYLASIAILLGGEFNVAVRERRRLRAAAAQENGGDLLGVVPGGHVPAVAQDELARGRWNRPGAADEPVVIRPGERERD
jgi:membrane protein